MYSRHTERRDYRIPINYNGVAFTEKNVDTEQRDAVGRPSALPHTSDRENPPQNKKIPPVTRHETPRITGVGRLNISESEEKATPKEEIPDQALTAAAHGEEPIKAPKKGHEGFSIHSDDALIASLILLFLGREEGSDNGTLLLLLLLLLY
ncbi:MAG: hypothetical protein U0M06_14660 [Clostridia bacterium]|nr:hypothetical protein [Clostridia bacterium]